jgi:hypothetical protein
MEDLNLGKFIKTRMVTVRLSDEEYQAVRTVTAARGYRSVSDLARAALQSLIAAPPVAPLDSVTSRLDEHASMIADLTREIERLHRATDGAFRVVEVQKEER